MMKQPNNRYGLPSPNPLLMSREDRRLDSRHRGEGHRCHKGSSYLRRTGHFKTPHSSHKRGEYFVSFRKAGVVTKQFQTPAVRFKILLNEWREETGGLSIARQIQSHPIYLKIIGMGERALPHLLTEVQQGRRFLFVALESIADDDPASEAKTFEEARDAWIKWGKDRNLI